MGFQFANGKTTIPRQRDDWTEVHEQLMQVQKDSEIQKKSLEVSEPGDSDEKEADEIAGKVVNGQTAEIAGNGGLVQRKGEGSAETNPEFESKLGNSKGGGESLPENLQQELGSKMGADFSGVKVHAGGEAYAMNKQVNANAFTHGQDIYFAQGAYNPGSKQGKELIAHELVHTKQQEKGNNGMIHRSARLEKHTHKKTVNVTGTINYFGPAATTAFARQATESINSHWNAAKGTVTLKEKDKKGDDKDVTYALRFKFDYFVFDPKKYSDAEVQKVALTKANDLSQNFVRVIQKPGKEGGVSNMTGNMATFYIDTADKAEYAHEFGHGMGLEGHTTGKPIIVIDDETGKKYESGAADFRGIVSIMIGGPDDDKNNYSLVDPEFAKDPKATVKDDPTNPGTVHASSGGAKLDPNKRRVSQYDIDNLKIQNALGENTTGYLNPVKNTSFSSWFGNITLDTHAPVIDEPTMYREALRQSGKKDAQYIQEIFIDFSLRGNYPNVTRIFSNPEKGKTEDNATVPEMKDLYTPGTIRYRIFDRNGNHEAPFHPDKMIDGLPAPNANWLPGLSQPEPMSK